MLSVDTYPFVASGGAFLGALLVGGPSIYFANRKTKARAAHFAERVEQALERADRSSKRVRIEPPRGYRGGLVDLLAPVMAKKLLPGDDWDVRVDGEAVVADAVRDGRKLRVRLRRDAVRADAWAADVSADDPIVWTEHAEAREQVEELATEMQARATR